MNARTGGTARTDGTARKANTAQKGGPTPKGRRRRRTLVVACWLVVAVLGLAALRIGGLMADESRAMDHYDHKDYVAARSGFARTTVLNPFNPWIGHFNAGTADYRLGDFVAAGTDFSKALTLAPPADKCMVGLNLAWSWEALGDMQRDGGHTDQAQESLNRAKQIVVALNCSQQPGPGSSSGAQPSGQDQGDANTARGQQEQTAQRVQSKIDRLQQSSAASAPDEATQQEQLQRREQEAQVANQQQGDGGANPTTQPTRRSW